MAVLHGSGVGELVLSGAGNGHGKLHGSGVGSISWRLAQIGTPTSVYARANLLPSPLTADLL